MNDRKTIAIYFDLENVDPKLDIGILLDSISLNIEEEVQAVFAIKLACGRTEAISSFRDQLRDSNFDIREAPQVSKGNLKNRADLILSIEAFETLVHNKPEIDLYVFITSDTDFTVVMDKLRKYGKSVWLVTRNNVMNNKLFSTSSDLILSIEDNFIKETKDIKTDSSKKTLAIDGFSKEHVEGILKVLESFEKDKWHPYTSFGSKLKNLYKDFTYKGKKQNSQSKLFEYLKEKGILDLDKKGKVDHFKVSK